MEEWQKFVYSLVDASKVVYTTVLKGTLLNSRQANSTDTGTETTAQPAETTAQPATETTTVQPSTETTGP